MSDHKLTEKQKLKIRQVEILYNQSPIILTGVIGLSLFCAGLLWYGLQERIIIQWLSANLLLCLARYLLYKRYKTSNTKQTQYQAWLNRYNAGTLISGLMWSFLLIGITNVTATKFDSLIYVGFMVVCLAGLVSGSIASYSVSFITNQTFSFATLFPGALYFLTLGNPVFSVLACMIIAFLGFNMLFSWRIQKVFTQSFTYAIQNKMLAQKLAVEKNLINELNKNLEDDIKKRIDTETQLIKEKVKAEQLAEKLFTISSRDGLTGIANRRNFDEHLAREWGRCARGGSPISLIMCDIDNFKEYNDHYGHQAGDHCLCLVADLLQDYARRGGELAARFGGEEFVLILPNTDSKTATRIAQQIRDDIAAVELEHVTASHGNVVTASFGVATMIPNKETPAETIIGHADKALYVAKRQGKNQVVTDDIRDQVLV